MLPSPSTSSVACPSDGHGTEGAEPLKVYEDALVSASPGAGSGRTACTTQKTITSSTTSGVQIFTRRTRVRTNVSGGGGVFVSSASNFSGSPEGGSGCCLVRSG